MVLLQTGFFIAILSSLVAGSWIVVYQDRSSAEIAKLLLLEYSGNREDFVKKYVERIDIQRKRNLTIAVLMTLGVIAVIALWTLYKH